MSPLLPQLLARIRADGPMRLSDYMAECLFHPAHGYYTRAEPFGESGDFITAPEISQMFGEVLGLALAQYWLDLGSPAPFALAELGPGRGTLMADVLRATRGVEGFHAALRLHLLEASPRLRAVQARTLAGYAPVWLTHVEDLPEAPLFLLANEFFDALPIRQFTRDTRGWRETMVGTDGERLLAGLSPPLDLPSIAHRLADTRPGEVVEFCPALPAIAAAIGGRIARHGGLALVVDYGGWHGRGDTFQALRRHAYADPFAAPGQADLTAHVDFEAIALAARPATHAYSTQGAVLAALGIAARAARLAQGLSGSALATHEAALRRLTGPAQMGEVFKVLALYPDKGPAPPGFAHA